MISRKQNKSFVDVIFFNYLLDVSGGESPSMLLAIRDCVKASNVTSFSKSEGFKALSYKEAFFLATLGGSQGKSRTV